MYKIKMLTMARRTALPITFTIFLILLLAPVSLTAQRTLSYLDLANRSESPNIYATELIVPGNASGDTTFDVILSYRIKNSYLTFKKRNTPGYSAARSDEQSKSKGSDKNTYFATLEAGLEVYHYDKNEVGKNKVSEISLNKLQPASRYFKKDTAYTESYNHTSATDLFVNRTVDVNLKPGKYIYQFTIQQDGGDEAGYKRRRIINVNPLGTDSSEAAFYTHNIDDGKGELLNVGNRIIYGQDFYANIHIPGYSPQTDYHLKINRLKVQRGDTSKHSTQFEKVIDDSEISRNALPDIQLSQGKPFINFKSPEAGQGYAFAHIKVPGSSFPNTYYSVSLYEVGNKKVIYKDTVQSLWIDMPKSLLNINVALDMLRFILPEEKLDKLKDGNFEEKKEKFNKFWAEKDPTPSTQYNELMAEYYKRIDYAFREFGSMRVPGYRTDQGKVYIQNGPPADKQRNYPSDGRSIETWTYPAKNLKFVFRASTGFGDYKLVKKESLDKQ